jgi:hypothetical protein
MTGYLYYVAMSEMQRQMEDSLVGSGPGPAIAENPPHRISRTSLFAGLRHVVSTGIARIVAANGGTGAGNRAGQTVGAVTHGCGS